MSPATQPRTMASTTAAPPSTGSAWPAPAPAASPGWAAPPQGAPPAKGGGMAIASLVLGIVGICLTIFTWIDLPVVLVGLVLGILGLKSPRRGMALAGVILCSIALVLIVVLLIVALVYGNDLLEWAQKQQDQA